MDDHANRKSEEKKKKKEKKKTGRREATGESERDEASWILSHGLQISTADDAASLQKRNEKKSRKLLRLHTRTGEYPAENSFFEKKQIGLKLKGLENYPLEDERRRKRNSTENEEDQDILEGELHKDIVGKIKKKKKKKRDNMDVYGSLHIETQKEQEQQEADQHSLDENLHTESKKGEKKSSKRKKRADEGDQHSEEGNLLKENNKGEQKRSKKKKEKKRKEEEIEKAEAPLQKIITESSFGDHEMRRKEKKDRKLAKDNGGDVFEGVVNANDKMAEKAKQTQDTLYKSGGEVGNNGSVKEDKSASSSKARKHSKEPRNSVERGGHGNEDHDLLSNNIECSEEPLEEQLVHATNTCVTIDSCPKEQEKGKKKERKRKTVTFQDVTCQDQINVTDQQHLRDIPNAASENSMEIAEEVWGVRFTAEEDEILKDAVWKFIKSKGWDEQEGLNKVFHSMKHKDARNCWADIKLALPHRPRPAIRYRAHLLLEKGAHAGKWSEEEEQLLNRLQGEHGHKWREISALLDRHRTSIKEKWRSLKRTKGKGVWTQGELQQLSDMVHKCLRAKTLFPAKNEKPDRRILRDDINWEKIADNIGTHNHGSCCGKWYYNLQSSLVTDGLWANEDDLLLLQSILESGACVEEEVEWDSLLNHRSGQVCLMRWKQMVKHLGENRTRQFLDKLDILAKRYAPELLESSIDISIGNSLKENPPGSAEIRD